MNMTTTTRHKATLRERMQGMLLLLLLMTAGAQGAWAAVTTVRGEVFYEQDYEAYGIGADWTTNTNGRHTPTILTEGGNHFMAANPAETYHNGATLTGPALNIAADKTYVLSFDLRLRKANNNSYKSEFWITNAAGDKFFSLTQSDNTGDGVWKVNGTTDVTLSGTQYVNNGVVNDLHWFRFKLKWDGTDMTLDITDKGTDFSTSTPVLASTTIAPLVEGKGIGNMSFYSGRAMSKFAIDNIRATTLFSYASEAANIDITEIGTADRLDLTSLFPGIVDEITGTVTETAYSSSDMTVMKPENTGNYLVGTGTTSIGYKKRIQNSADNYTDYKTSFDLTIYGSPATINSGTATNSSDNTKTDAWWELMSEGLTDASVEVGVVTMTSLFGTETGVSVVDPSNNNAYVLRVIDANGYTHTNVGSNTLHEDSYGGTFYRFDIAQSGKLQIWGTGAESATLLNNLSTSEIRLATSTASGTSTWEDLSAGTYYLYNTSLHSFTYTYATPKLKWSDIRATVDINDLGISNPNVASGLPTLTLIGEATIDSDYNNTNSDQGMLNGTWINGYCSLNQSVAIIADNGAIHIIGPGTTIIKAKAAGGTTDDYIAAYKLVVEANDVTHTITTSTNTLSFDEVGKLPAGQVTANLTNLSVTYGHTDETSIVTTCNDMTVLKVIDSNGWSQPNLTGEGTVIPWEGSAGGTFVKLNATQDGYLIVTGNVNNSLTRIYKWGTTTTTPQQLTPEFNEEQHTMAVTLATNETGDNYYLYNIQHEPWDETYIPPVHSISFVQGFFANAYEAVRFEDIESYQVQEVKGLSSPTYTIVETKGDVFNGNPLAVDGSRHITSVAGGGTIHIRATQDTKSVDYYLTVAYPATASGKIWDFNDGSSIHSITTVPSPTTTDGDWTAKYKNINNNREPRWFYNKAVAGDNAFVIEKTAGLIFETSAGGFYMRNDGEIWHHVGIHRQKASFTIPLLKAGDIVELNWKRDAESSGANFSATNVKDLRGKSVDEIFNITGSRNKYRDGVNIDQGGLTSFEVAQDGDVKFTMEDTGYNDLLSVRIYSGGYQPTMSAINQYDGALGIPAPKTILLDNATQSVTLNYCNLLNSTATGPAMYVLKGYRSGTDNIECVTGKDSQKPGINFSDEEAYPISSAEQDFLYEQRKNLVGFRMYNYDWESSNNTYNNGVIQASSGYGKVTVRMNNYTNDLKYVIGYTPDYTLTFGSAPHQEYPYTWNFENISGGAVKDNSNNAYNSVSTDYYTWDNYGNYRFGLNTHTDGGSLYVPGATLVSEDRELNNDEFAGLGFTGGMYFQTADGTDAVDEAIESTEEGNLLSYTLNSSNYNEAAIASGSDHAGYWNAGAGWVKFGSSSKRNTSTVAASGAAYTMDGGDSKYILLAPKRPFRNGDILKFKIHFTADDPLCTGSNYGLCFRTEAKKEGPYLANVFLPAGTAKKTETEITYTVRHGDGLVGRSEIYVFRAVVPITPLLSYVTVTAPTGNLSEGVSYGKHITVPSSGSLTITVPDLNANSKQDWIYIKSSVAPSNITNATAAVAEDGLDAASGVYKYKVTDAGNSDITFPANATISSIGVTHILKPLKQVGDGDAWATESRDCAIDHTRTGFFTVNNIEAKYVTVAKYDIKYANVKLNDVGSYGVPKDIGLVLKMKMKYAAGDAGGAGGTMTAAEAETATSNAATNFAKTINYNSSDKTGDVPLFAPAISTNRLTTLGFNGTLGNMMRPNVTARPFTTECEDGNGANAAGGAYTRFILATHYMKWKKVGTEAVTHDAIFNEGHVPVFYRMHLYNNEEATALSSTEAILNTLGANKAYLSLRTANLPEALWKSSVSGGAKGYIGISGISDFTDYSEYSDYSMKPAKSGTYNMSGQKMSDEAPLPAGIYIKDGRKIVVH